MYLDVQVTISKQLDCYGRAVSSLSLPENMSDSTVRRLGISIIADLIASAQLDLAKREEAEPAGTEDGTPNGDAAGEAGDSSKS